MFINLYRDEPVFQQPYRILTALIDVDESFTIWRQRHALMAHRMLGRQTGTAGSGYTYLDETAKRYKAFKDLFDLSTYLLPRSALPPLPRELSRLLDFRVRGVIDSSQRPVLAIAYGGQSASALKLSEPARARCDIVWVVDSSTFGDTAMFRLLRKLGTVVDVAGLSEDAAAAALAPLRPDGIVAYADSEMATASSLAGRLGLDYHDAGVTERLVDKLSQRRALRDGRTPGTALRRTAAGRDRRRPRCATRRLRVSRRAQAASRSRQPRHRPRPRCGGARRAAGRRRDPMVPARRW